MKTTKKMTLAKLEQILSRVDRENKKGNAMCEKMERTGKGRRATAAQIRKQLKLTLTAGEAVRALVKELSLS